MIIAILGASLIGSLHCVGMCGAFVAMATATEGASGARLHTAYSLGRLATYVSLGAVAGALGHALDLGGNFVGVPKLAAMLAGAIMVVFGLSAVARSLGVRTPRMPVPAVMQRAAEWGYSRVDRLGPTARAGAIGLLTTLLPCGWLYAFVATAAGTASPLWGGLAMAAFWAGTLPALVAFGLGVQRLAGPLRRHVPLATSVLLVAVGLVTIGARMRIGGQLGPAVREASLGGVQEVGHTPPPCCNGGGTEGSSQ